MPFKDPNSRRLAVRDRRRRIKELINSLKTKCVRCGYSKCKSALGFHHPNDDKTMTLASAQRHCYSDERIRAEAARCQVMCANCHAELHWG